MSKIIGYLTGVALLGGTLVVGNYIRSTIWSGVASVASSSLTSPITLKQEVMTEVVEDRPLAYFGNQAFMEGVTIALKEGELLINKLVSEEEMEADVKRVCELFEEDTSKSGVVDSIVTNRFGYQGLYVTKDFSEGNAGARYADSLVKVAARRNCYKYYEAYYSN